VYNSSNTLQDVYYVGADNQIHAWDWTGSTFVNAALGSSEPAASQTSPAGVFLSSSGDVSVYYVGANAQMYSWFSDGKTWTARALGNGEPADAGTVPSSSPATGPNPAPATGSGPVTIAPKPRKGHLHVRIIMTWHWTKATTRLTKLRWIGLPKRATVTVSCTGRGCPARTWSGRPGKRRRLRTLTGARFHAADRITITISQRGLISERAKVVIRANRIPKTKLL
jgi:hypothetical protein